MLFADVLFLAIFRFIRRFFRIRQARRWPKTSAVLTDWTCIDADQEYRSGWSDNSQIQSVFEYFVFGERFVGLIKSIGIKEASAWRYVDDASKPTEIVIRYNPSDPAQYRVLQEDNGSRLGFDIAIY